MNNSEKIAQARAEKMYLKVKCPTCAGQSVKDSNSIVAIYIKQYILEQISEGVTEDKIKLTLSNAYGPQIISETHFSIDTLTLWIFPLIVLLIMIKQSIKRKFLSRL